MLLHLLAQWCADHAGAPALRALHVNHGLQAEAPHWQSHCEALCRAWGIPCETLPVTVAAQASTEAAAREARYGAFEAVLPETGVLFLAHHLDDQIETFFLRLMRGAGVDGLSAMRPIRPLGSAQVCRPLLPYPAADIERYAQEFGLDFIEDPSNRDTRMDRNYLRQAVLPLLEARWPGYRKTVGRAAVHIRQAREAAQSGLHVPPLQHNVMGDPGLPLAALADEAGGQRLRAWLQARGHMAPSQAALGEFLRQLEEGAGVTQARLDAGRYVLQRYRDAVYLLPALPAAPEASAEHRLQPGVRLDIPGLGALRLRQCAEQGFALSAGEEVRVAWRAGREKLRLPGRAGSRTLKALFQELSVPPWWRRHVPLLFLGDEMLAVGDVAGLDSSRWRERAATGETLWQLAWERPQ